jgi:hypothetical protein
VTESHAIPEGPGAGSGVRRTAKPVPRGSATAAGHLGRLYIPSPTSQSRGDVRPQFTRPEAAGRLDLSALVKSWLSASDLLVPSHPLNTFTAPPSCTAPSGISSERMRPAYSAGTPRPQDRVHRPELIFRVMNTCPLAVSGAWRVITRPARVSRPAATAGPARDHAQVGPLFTEVGREMR